MNAQSPGGVSRQAAPAGRVGISAPALLCNDGIAVESKSHFRRPAIHGVEELDQAAHAGLLIIPPAHVAAVFAEQVAAVLQLLGQRFRAGGGTRSGLRSSACSVSMKCCTKFQANWNPKLCGQHCIQPISDNRKSQSHHRNHRGTEKVEKGFFDPVTLRSLRLRGSPGCFVRKNLSEFDSEFETPNASFRQPCPVGAAGQGCLCSEPHCFFSSCPGAGSMPSCIIIV